jgi:heme exporter protein D
MQWQSLPDFFAMGGYALYVWLSFGATALCMAGELLSVRQRHATALKQGARAGGALKP